MRTISVLLRAPRLATVMALFGLLSTAQPIWAQGPQYTFYQMDDGFSPAMDVNDDGTVVGWTTDTNVGFAGY
jgi:hypothetical protein